MDILALNCGSSSVKYQLYNWDKKEVIAKGVVERVGIGESFIAHHPEVARPRRIQQATGLQVRRHEDRFLHFPGIGNQRRQMQYTGIEKQQRIAIVEYRKAVLQRAAPVAEHQVQAVFCSGGGY